MRSKAPALFPVFRSRAQAEILAATLLHPEREQTITDLARRLRIPLATVSDEIVRLLGADIFTVRKVGRSKLLRPNGGNRVVGPLTEIVLATMGSHQLVQEASAGRDRADAVVDQDCLVARRNQLVASAGGRAVDRGDVGLAAVLGRVLDAVAGLVGELAAVHLP